MSADLRFFTVLLQTAMTERDEETLIWKILTPFSKNLSDFLSNPKNSSLQKLELILTISPKLRQFLEESDLLKKVLFKCGNQSNITVICREIFFNAGSFPELIDQSAYTTALLKFTSSGFPPLLADLPSFLKANLLDKYETLNDKASKAAAAAEKAKRDSYNAAFAKCWAEVPAEHLPALEEGRRLRREWWNEHHSSKKPFTKEQLEHLKSYDKFKSFVHLKVRENK